MNGKFSLTRQSTTSCMSSKHRNKPSKSSRPTS